MRDGVVADEVVDDDALECANFRGLLRTAQAGAETKEERRGDDIAHGDVGDGDVLAERAVFAFESEALAAIEDAVGDGDVLEAAIGFGSTLDATVAGEVGYVGRELLIGSIEHG